MWYTESMKTCCWLCYYVHIRESCLFITEGSYLIADYLSKNEFKHCKIFKAHHGFGCWNSHRWPWQSCTPLTGSRTILCPEAPGRDAQLDANQTTSGKGSQTSLNKVSSCLQQQAVKPCKTFVSLCQSCGQQAERARLLACHATGTLTRP